MNRANDMFSFIWNPIADETDLRITEAQELSDSYPGDLKAVVRFVEETWCRPVKTLFGIGQVTSLQFLKRIYAKRLQNASHNMYHFKNFCLHIYPTWLPKQNVVSAN